MLVKLRRKPRCRSANDVRGVLGPGDNRLFWEPHNRWGTRRAVLTPSLHHSPPPRRPQSAQRRMARGAVSAPEHPRGAREDLGQVAAAALQGGHTQVQRGASGCNGPNRKAQGEALKVTEAQDRCPGNFSRTSRASTSAPTTMQSASGMAAREPKERGRAPCRARGASFTGVLDRKDVATGTKTKPCATSPEDSSDMARRGASAARHLPPATPRRSPPCPGSSVVTRLWSSPVATYLTLRFASSPCQGGAHGHEARARQVWAWRRRANFGRLLLELGGGFAVYIAGIWGDLKTTEDVLLQFGFRVETWVDSRNTRQKSRNCGRPWATFSKHRAKFLRTRPTSGEFSKT